MLHLLTRYAQDQNLEAEPGFKPKDVRWAIVCDAHGVFLDAVELGDPSVIRNRGLAFPRCPDLSQPEMKAGGVTKSHFLVETAEVFALYGRNAQEPKTKAKHDYFLKLLQDASGTVPELLAPAACLASEDNLALIRQRLESLKAKAADKLTFRVENAFPVQSSAWHQWWRDFRKKLGAEDTPGPAAGNGAAVRCFVTGDLVKPTLTHPKIEGLSDVGGLSMGDVLIGFKQDSFCSYGFEQSANAAMSETTAAAYRAALNGLIRNHGHRLAGAKVVHWFKTSVPPDDDPLPWLIEPPLQQERAAQDRADALLRSVRDGRRPDLASNHYYALTLSGAGGRVMLRDWMDGRFEELVGNVRAWFEDLSIVDRGGGALAPSPKFLAVAASLVRELKDLPPSLVAGLWRAAAHGELLSHAALAGALYRTRVGIIQDQPFSRAGMALLKAYHARKIRAQGGTSVSQSVQPYLNPQHPDPAYQCGRLLAVLAALQRSALGPVGAGIVQRYYAAASSTPALVFGRLARTAQFHINKLDGGLAYWYESGLAAIASRIGDRMPATLTLEGQSLFALGYYQQLAELRTKKIMNSQDTNEDNNDE